MNIKNRISIARIFAAAAFVLLPVAVIAAPKDKGPKGDKPELPAKEEAPAPRPHYGRDCYSGYDCCPYCGAYYGHCRRDERRGGPEDRDDFYGPRHHRGYDDVDEVPPHLRGEGRREAPGRRDFDDRDDDLRGGYGWYYQSLTDTEKKDFLAKRKAYFDERDAERKAAYEKMKQAREEFDKKWNNFDKLSIEEQEQLLRMKARRDWR